MQNGDISFKSTDNKTSVVSGPAMNIAVRKMPLVIFSVPHYKPDSTDLEQYTRTAAPFASSSVLP